jgi:prefoldin subunit 5
MTTLKQLQKDIDEAEEAYDKLVDKYDKAYKAVLTAYDTYADRRTEIEQEEN